MRRLLHILTSWNDVLDKVNSGSPYYQFVANDTTRRFIGAYTYSTVYVYRIEDGEEVLINTIIGYMVFDTLPWEGETIRLRYDQDCEWLQVGTDNVVGQLPHSYTSPAVLPDPVQVINGAGGAISVVFNHNGAYEPRYIRTAGTRSLPAMNGTVVNIRYTDDVSSLVYKNGSIEDIIV